MSTDLQFQEIEHTADRAFKIRAQSLPELFVLAARAICTAQRQPTETQEMVTREVEISGPDRETLLVNWLNELLYLQEVYSESYFAFQVAAISDTHLRASVVGDTDASARRTIKAVTFHGLKIQRLQDEWEATITVDV